VFQDDIARLLTMSDMWRFRAPPMPLDRNLILNVTSDDMLTSCAGSTSPMNSQPQSSVNGTLKDQRALTLRDNVLLFDSRNVVVETEPLTC
jgi:ubiquitin-like 1-activating enzyme E1 B